MTTEEFNKLVIDRCEKTMAILTQKASEYARGDRLSNFTAAAGFLQCTPERALQGMRIKHEVSLRDMVDDLSRGALGMTAAASQWDEKIGDDINYLILLEALVRERIQNEDGSEQRTEMNRPAPSAVKTSRRR